MSESEETPDNRPVGDPNPGIGDSDASVSWLEQGLDVVRNVGSRYSLLELIGQGSFGKVYRALDRTIVREVAYKVSYVHSARADMDDKEHRAALRVKFQEEAQKLAKLEHENLVSILDAGETSDGGYYIVSKLIRGENLSKWNERVQPSTLEILRVLQAIGNALVHVHSQSVVHGDIKPANILIDSTGKPFLIDFGLAIHESEIVYGFGTQGSPAYMSPEQARQEPFWQRTPSDIYSLGVVLFELLAGRRPFIATDPKSLMKQIGGHESPSIRQFRPDLSASIERVCTRALARLASNRYQVVQDFVDDIAGCRAELEQTAAIVAPAPIAEARIVPKGLRAFDSNDSDFYLRLLPGPKNRLGIPDAITFWQEFVAVESVARPSIGILHGPSGCGKTSLLRAGILPRLDKSVHVIYVDAMSDDFEASIEQAIRKKMEWPLERPLYEELPKLRSRPVNCGKQLIVIDQFEQFLHRTQELRESTLVRTLRLLDGSRFQAILSIRSDYWNQLCRLLAELQIKASDENCRHVDLFEQSHAGDVLRYFGQAYGKLPDAESWKESDSKFLERAISELSTNNRVVPVRLAMFTQILQSTAWSVESLGNSGGVDGLYQSFLDRLFLDKYSDVRYRLVADSVQKLLAELLPISGTEIRGHARTAADLRNSIGFKGNDAEFTELLRILDRELRVITPVFAVESAFSGSRIEEADESGNRKYQLTHDFLVPSIRSWIDQSLSKTPAGRAFRQLRTLSDAWSVAPEKRNLPTFFEWLGFRLFARKFAWNERQRLLMSCTDRYHLSRALASVALIAIFSVAAYSYNSRSKGLAVVERLKNANVESVLTLANEASVSRFWTEDSLKRLADRDASSPKEKREQLHALLALATITDRYNGDLVKALLNETNIHYSEVICQQLQQARINVADNLTECFRDTKRSNYERINAGLYLIRLDSPKHVLTKVDLDQLVRLIVVTNPTDHSTMLRLFSRHRDELAYSYAALLNGEELSKNETFFAMDGLVLLEKPNLIDLDKIYARSSSSVRLALANWMQNIEAISTDNSLDSPKLPKAFLNDSQPSVSEKVVSTKFKASKGMLLIRSGRANEAMEVFQFDNDPGQVYQFIYDCKGSGLTLNELLPLFELLSFESRDPADWDKIYGVVLSMGDFSSQDLNEEDRRKLVEQLVNLYENHPSSGVHGATGWLLRKWGKQDLVDRVDNREIKYSPERQWFTVKAENPGNDTFFLTFVVIPAGQYYVSRFGKEDSETLRPVRISSSFAILDRELTFQDLSSKRLPTVSRNIAKAVASNGPKPILDYESVMKLAAGGTSWRGATTAADQLSMACNLEEHELVYGGQFLSNFFFSYDKIDIGRRGFRLPTVTEWEIANRCGCNTNFSTGNDPAILAQHAWTFESGQNLSVPKEKRPNRWGIFDMDGNVREWCHDYVSDVPLEFDDNEVDPVSRTGEYNSLKGGAIDRVSEWAACGSLSRDSKGQRQGNAYSGVRPVIRLPLPSPLGLETENDKAK